MCESVPVWISANVRGIAAVIKACAREFLSQVRPKQKKKLLPNATASHILYSLYQYIPYFLHGSFFFRRFFLFLYSSSIRSTAVWGKGFR